MLKYTLINQYFLFFASFVLLVLFIDNKSAFEY